MPVERAMATRAHCCRGLGCRALADAPTWRKICKKGRTLIALWQRDFRTLAHSKPCHGMQGLWRHLPYPRGNGTCGGEKAPRPMVGLKTYMICTWEAAPTHCRTQNHTPAQADRRTTWQILASTDSDVGTDDEDANPRRRTRKHS